MKKQKQAPVRNWVAKNQKHPVLAGTRTRKTTIVDNRNTVTKEKIMDENFCPECGYNVGPIWKYTECPLCGYSEADEEEEGELPDDF